MSPRAKRFLVFTTFAVCNVVILPLVVFPMLLWIPSDAALEIVAGAGVCGALALAWIWTRAPKLAAVIQVALLVAPVLMLIGEAQPLDQTPRLQELADPRLYLALVVFVIAPAMMIAASVVVLLRWWRRVKKSKRLTDDERAALQEFATLRIPADELLRRMKAKIGVGDFHPGRREITVAAMPDDTVTVGRREIFATFERYVRGEIPGDELSNWAGFWWRSPRTSCRKTTMSSHCFMTSPFR